MNKHTRKDDLMRPEVTTGPLRASKKVYTTTSISSGRVSVAGVAVELAGQPATMKTTFVGGYKSLPLRYTLAPA